MRNVLLGALSCLAVAAASAAVPGVFDDRSILEFTLEAPFDDLFAGAQANADQAVPGRLSWQGTPTTHEGVLKNIAISERGHTSRQASECDFPKLKIDLSSADLDGSPFAGQSTLKIGTHCGERADEQLTPKYGRLANERAPLREALVYHILHAVGVPTLLARPARVTYVFSGGSGRPPLTRLALALEDDQDARTRVGGIAEIEETEFSSAREQFDEGDTARLAFAEALIGNFDWCLRMFPGDIYRCNERHPLWNVLTFTRAAGPAVPVIYDFDLSGPVVGRHVWFTQVFDAAFVDPPSSIDVEVLAQVQRTRSLFSRARLDATRTHFFGARTAVEQVIEDSPADERGKELARTYVRSFYSAIEDARFYRPVVVEGGHRATLDAAGTQPACGSRSLVPAGTPVSAPIEQHDNMVRVRVLDALWEWTDNSRCDAVRTQPVWIPMQAIGTDYPR